MIQPDYIFECSWEVCNKVGGIYTVLSTKARTLQQQFPDHILFIGPDLGHAGQAAEFDEDSTLYADWRRTTAAAGLPVRIGRWRVPGAPLVMLVDYRQLFSHKNELFYEMWESFGVDSSQAYGDYDESCIFAAATGRVIESFYRFHHLESQRVVAHFDEWMLGFGLLHLRKYTPRIATLFTTHATTIGRSIAGNNKPLYGYMSGYNGDGMAAELHVEAKHSVEKKAAHFADCFTTVSEITAVECRQLLDKAPDVVTPNGFEPDFVPTPDRYPARRADARQRLLRAASALYGQTFDSDNTFLVSISGRYEYRNKGIDVFIDAMNRLRTSADLPRAVVAFVLIPAWVYAPRADLKAILEHSAPTTAPLPTPFLTHWLHRMDDDRVSNFILHAGFNTIDGERLKIVFVPCYLDGRDGIFDTPYYDLLIGMDATLYPSYYEPWGYTPLESVAFGIPTVTTDLAGFGRWAQTVVSGRDITEGVAVVHRTDDNYAAVVNESADALLTLMRRSDAERRTIAARCQSLAARAEWERFITYYYTAFDHALTAAARRADA